MYITEKMRFNSGIFYATLLFFRMARCNTATLAVELISVLQIILSFFLTGIDDKIMFLQESSTVKMSNRLNEHSSLSSLLIAKKWKLPYSYVGSPSVHVLFLLQF